MCYGVYVEREMNLRCLASLEVFTILITSSKLLRYVKKLPSQFAIMNIKEKIAVAITITELYWINKKCWEIRVTHTKEPKEMSGVCLHLLA